MNSSNTQGKIIISSNFTFLNSLNNEERKILKLAQSEETEGIKDEGLKDAVEIINYFEENNIDEQSQTILKNRIETLKNMGNNTLKHVVNLGEKILKTNEDNFNKSNEFLEYIEEEGLAEDIAFVAALSKEIDSLKSDGALIHVVNIGKMYLEQGIDIIQPYSISGEA